MGCVIVTHPHPNRVETPGGPGLDFNLPRGETPAYHQTPVLQCPLAYLPSPPHLEAFWRSLLSHLWCSLPVTLPRWNLEVEERGSVFIHQHRSVLSERVSGEYLRPKM